MSRLLVALAALVFSACGRGEDAQPHHAGNGANGGSGASSGGASGGMNEVASVLDGYVMKQPCLESSGPRACRTHPPGACPANQEPAFAGAKPTDDTLALGGRAGTLYDVTLHVQGIVESKAYRGGVDASELLTNGFLTAGTIDNVKNQHSAFAMRVTAPTGVYFFNSLGREAVRHSVFAVDYEATITIGGGTPFELWVTDPNCEALKNCGDPDVPTECHPIDVPNLDPKIRQTLGSDPLDYNGQFLGFVVTNVAQRN
jgi:hypothetical protein